MKYFSVLKDVPNIPAESYGPRQRDSVRLSIFPNLNYTGLYHAVLNMIDIVPTMQVKQLGTLQKNKVIFKNTFMTWFTKRNPLDRHCNFYINID